MSDATTAQEALTKLDVRLSELANRYMGTLKNYYLHGLWLAREEIKALRDSLPEEAPPNLIVTRNRIPVADQEQGVRDFKAACLRKPHTNSEPMDCTSDLQLLWRADEADFRGYDYHTPDRVADTVLREIAYLRVRAEGMEEWLLAYQAQRKTSEKP